MHRIRFAAICASCLSSLGIGFLWIGSRELSASPDGDGEPSDKTKGQLVVETMPQAPEALPKSLRITFKNTRKEPLRFTEPSPLCPEAVDEKRQYPLLGIQLVDEKGLESPSPPVLTDISKAKLKKPRTVTLKPGQTWSKEYPLTDFYPWGPCGPAAPFPELFKPGSTPVQCSVFLFSGDGSRLGSNSFTVKVKVPKGFFESPSVATSEEEVDELFDLMRDSPEPPGKPAKLSELISQLRESPFDLRLYAAIEIGKRGEKAKEAIPALVKLLESADARDRLLALYALQEMGSSAKDAVPALKQLGEDKSPRVREKAEEALAAIEGKTLSSTGEPTYAGRPVSYWIAAATKELDVKKLKERAARGEQEDLAEEKARQVLIRMGAKAAPYLIKGLNTEDTFSRSTLASILGELRNREEVSSLLIEALRSDAVQVRRGAAQALGEDSSEESEQKPSDRVVAALSAALKDPDPETQESAARALGQPGLKLAVPALVDALEGTSADLRRLAAVALGNIGPEASPAVPALKGLLKDESALVRGAARRALKELGGSDPQHVDFFKRAKDYLAQRTAKEPLKKLSETELMRLSWEADGIFFVVDRSGSSTEGFRFAKRYMANVVKSLGPESQFGIVLVDAGTAQYPTEPTPARADEEGKEAGLSFINSAVGGHGSCPLAGFQKALDLAEKSAGHRKVILYIGDGGGTCGAAVPESDYLEHTFETITARNQGKVEVYAIGVGTVDIVDGFLLYLTEQNGGSYTHLILEK